MSEALPLSARMVNRFRETYSDPLSLGARFIATIDALNRIVDDAAAELQTAIERLETAEAGIDRVRKLHAKVERTGGTQCRVCFQIGGPRNARYAVSWPCPTIAALNEEDVKQ